MSHAVAQADIPLLSVPSGRLLAAIFDLSPDAIALNRVGDGIFVAVNAGFTLLTGLAPGEAQGRSLAEIGILADRAELRPLVARLQREGALRNLELRLRHRSGAIRTGLLSANVVQLGREALVLSVYRDVTERARAQAEKALLEGQLRQAQKLDALGRLAGGIAHDFNNLVTVIQAAVLDARREPLASPRLRETLSDVEVACGRAAALTRQLTAFGRAPAAGSGAVDPAALIAGLRRHLERVVPAPAALCLEVGGGLPAVAGDPVQIEQVVLNLVQNARDALRGAGRVTLQVAAARAAELPAQARASGQPFVRFTVADDGAGMPPEVQARLFEPFFTTKEPGKGTGLGLATVHGIVQRHRGFISVRSEPGRGSTFDVFLPAFRAALRPIPAGEESPARLTPPPEQGVEP
ncbi:MAG: PAS domain S-box protein [Deltaproteobacteria bacterium]|nr:PAS domain S-box protein [Deltaproteobacteria bacterium]